MTTKRVTTGALVVCAISVAFAVVMGRTQSPGPHVGPTVPVVVELFTSEGCSSCPPADKLLSDLIKQQPVEGALIIGLSEHVDYWNHLGWKDPFSDHLFSARQSAYAATDIYTPQMIVDGRESFVGSDRVAAFAAISKAASTQKAPIALSWTTSTPRALSVKFSGGAPAAGGTVFLAIVEDDLQSSVRAGENSGTVLRHSAVTRRLTDIGHADRSGAFGNENVRVELAPTWRTDALHVVIFVAGSNRHVVAAASIRP
jgi:hypothetical protein